MTFDGRPAPTGWKSLIHAGTGGVVRYSVNDGEVIVQVNATFASLAAGSQLTLVTAANGIPADLCPSIGVYDGCYSGNAVGWFLVGADGSVIVRAATAAMASAGGITNYPIG